MSCAKVNDMKSIIKKLLVRSYSWCLRTYDRFTADRIECSIADIILQRGDVVKENQLLLSSRLCDVEDYCDRGLQVVYIKTPFVARRMVLLIRRKVETGLLQP